MRLTVSETLKRTAEGTWEFEVEPSATATRIVVSDPVTSGGVCTIKVMTQSQVSGFTPVENRELKRLRDLATMSEKRWIPMTERAPELGALVLVAGRSRWDAGDFSWKATDKWTVTTGRMLCLGSTWVLQYWDGPLLISHWQPLELPKEAP